MLSRVADSLYWMSRYLERVEHSARVIDVHLNLMLDQSQDSTERRWHRLCASLGMPQPADAKLDARHLLHALAFDYENRSSIVSCIVGARENARQVREQISSEMWEQINKLYHELKRLDLAESWDAEPMEFLAAVKERVHLFHGITDSTMAHGVPWQFLQIGRALERATATAALLDVHSFGMSRSGEWDPDSDDHLEWIGLLRSCTAFEAYCKQYTAELSPDRIAEFLLLNEEFPHAICFSVRSLQESLHQIRRDSGGHKPERLERLAGKLHSTLRFSPIDDVMNSGMHAYLAGVQAQCGQIHTALYQVYVNYPIEASLA